MKKIGKLFLQGLTAIIPITITLYILFWLIKSAEALLGSLIQIIITDKYYITGMGVAAGILIVLIVGILLKIWLFNKLFGITETIFKKIPLVKSLYGSLRDLMSFFDTSTKKNFDKVVTVSLTDEGPRLLGLLTRDDFNELPEGLDEGKTVAVYLPMSYQMGGFTLFVEKSRIRPIDMSIEEAMRFTLTAAVSTNNK